MNIESPGNWDGGRGKRGVSTGRTGTFPVHPKNSAAAEKYYSARCKVLHGALQSISPNAENLSFLFFLSELPYYRQVILLLLDDAKVRKNEDKTKRKPIFLFTCENLCFEKPPKKPKAESNQFGLCRGASSVGLHQVWSSLAESFSSMSLVIAGRLYLFRQSHSRRAQESSIMSGHDSAIDCFSGSMS